MECSEVTEQLKEYFADAMDTASRSALEAHWQSCPSCREEADGLKAAWHDLGLIPVPPETGDPRQRFDRMVASYRQGLADGRSEPAHQRASLWLWPQPLAAQAFGALLILVMGLYAGSWFGGRGTSSLEALEVEVRSLRQLVAVSMLEQRSASQRLRGVSFTAQLDEPQPEVVTRLLSTLDSDSNVNVRLAVIEVLREFDDNTLVRDHMVGSLLGQPSPLVQVSMIDSLVEMGEVRSRPVLEMLLENDDLHQAVRDRALRGLSELS